MAEPRVDWHTYFMNIATQVSSRSTCPRKHVGERFLRADLAHRQPRGGDAGYEEERSARPHGRILLPCTKGKTVRKEFALGVAGPARPQVQGEAAHRQRARIAGAWPAGDAAHCPCTVAGVLLGLAEVDVAVEGAELEVGSAAVYRPVDGPVHLDAVLGAVVGIAVLRRASGHLLTVTEENVSAVSGLATRPFSLALTTRAGGEWLIARPGRSCSMISWFSFS